MQPQFAKWWLPDAIEFADEIPRTSAGKFLKTALREKYGDYYCPRRRLAGCSYDSLSQSRTVDSPVQRPAR